MAKSRVDIIIANVVEKLKAAGQGSYDTDSVLNRLNQIQLDIAQRALVIKDDFEFLTENGTDTYDLGVKLFRIKEFIEPLSWGKRLTILTDSDSWADAVRSNVSCVQPAIPVQYSQPLYVMIWDKYLKFFPAPVKTGDKIEIIAYRLPSKDLDEGGAPELDIKWDYCLELGCLSRIIGGDSVGMYEAELRRLGHQESNETMKPNVVEHFQDKTGF